MSAGPTAFRKRRSGFVDCRGTLRESEAKADAGATTS